MKGLLVIQYICCIAAALISLIHLLPFISLAPKTTDDPEILAKIDTLLQMGITEVIGCTFTPN